MTKSIAHGAVVVVLSVAASWALFGAVGWLWLIGSAPQFENRLYHH